MFFCPLRRVHLFVTHDLLSPFPFTIYGQQRVKTSYFSEKKYPSTIIGDFRHENWRSARNFFIKTKIFSLYMSNGGQKLLRFHYISPQYYWKVSIALRGCLEKFFIVLENFYCKTSHFTQKKNALTYIGNLMVGFTRFSRKKLQKFFKNVKAESFSLGF